MFNIYIKNLRYITLLVIYLFSMQLIYGQSIGRIYGIAYFEDKTYAKEASLEIEGMGVVATTDSMGKFSITLPVGKTYKLKISSFDKASSTKTVDLKLNKEVYVEFILNEDYVQNLSDLIVQGQTQNQIAKKEIVKAEIIDTKSAHSQSATLAEMMNKTAGVRARQSGGLGSTTNVVLNGFQGKSIKLFKDGIPMDYLGAGYNISATPVNMLERIEVFKGVLPTALGADALGGAMNMVSREQGARSLGVSYEISSFNTHRISLNWKHTDKANRFFFGVNAFYNYSDNNYSVTANVPDPQTATISPKKVKLFHNKYEHSYFEVYAGVKNLSWVDELRLGFTAFKIHRDNQFAALMEKPFGASYAEEKTPFIPTLRYKKEFADKKLSIDQFLVYSKISGRQVDTLNGAYDWFGNYFPSTDVNRRGESGNPTLADFTYDNLTSRTGLTYKINTQNNIALNVVFNDYNRKGTDPYGPKTIGDNPIDLQSLPANYTKYIGALGWEGHFMNNRIENLLQIKFFGAKTEGQEVDARSGYLKESISVGSTSKFGLAEAIKINISPKSYVRLSGELATRLPEQTEILGNGSYVLSNFNIKPEQSVNGNLGIRMMPNNKWDIELNSFYRITKDLIINVPVSLIFSQSSNVESVRGIGVEADVRFKPWDWLSLNSNLTYQDHRLYNIKAPLIQYLEGARLRNTPYFFTNIGAQFQFNKIFSTRDKIQAYYNMGYVHQYYLNYIPKSSEPDGFLGLWGEAKIDAPNIIPSQTIHSLGVLWQLSKDSPLTISVECKNLFNRDIYDNFKVQNAGRSFHLKINYSLKY